MPDGDLTGQTVRGYELHEAVGAGGFGQVYRAYQAAVRREVAVKVILPRYANQPEFIRRFEAEAQTVARLEHPYIVPLYDYWRDPGGAYLVMRWLSGGSLRGLIRNSLLSLEDVGRILDQIGAALTLAHRRNVIHLDLKPDNVLLDEEHNAYLADFGIAKTVGSQEESTEGEHIITGTPTYLAPEQIIGHPPISPRTDIYSLGVMLYELLVGEPPFANLSTTQVLQKQLYETLPPLIVRRADLPVGLDTVVQTATAKAPTERYANVISMIAAFHRGLATGIQRQNLDVTTGRVLTPPIHDTPTITPGSEHDTPTMTPVAASHHDTPTLTPASEPRAPAATPIYDTPTITPADALAFVPDNPYKGLRAFEEADAADFFGRETLIDQLLARLTQRETLARFLAVVGPSGSGKSSAVKAGLIPAIRRGALPGSDRWFVVEMTPGVSPFDELADALQRVAATPAESLSTQLQSSEQGLLNAVEQALPSDKRVELVLVIDQFEELFTLSADQAACAPFLAALLSAVTAPESRLRLIVTLRADFYDRPLLYPDFGELIRKRTEVVLPLKTDELREAIIRPAERAGLTLENGLIEAIVRDVGDQPGALPLLQYALTELFERRQDRTLTVRAYQDSGGVVGALARRADSLYVGLMPDDQTIVRQIFLRLVTPGEGVEDTRRRALRPELSIAGEDRAIEAILNRFGQYRLLTFDRDPITRIPTVEIAHEALIRTWGRLRDWLAVSRDDLKLQRRLTAAAAEWSAARRDPGFLATDARLEQFESWAKQTSLALSQDEKDYLQTSLEEREARRLQDEARKAREEAIARRAQTFGRAAAVLGVVGVLAVIATIFAVLQASNANAAVSQANAQLNLAAQTLTPVPATLTPVSLTLAAGNAQIVAARATATQVAGQIVSVQLAALSGRALVDPSAGPEAAMLLAIQGLRTAYSPEADTALTTALDSQYTVQRLVGHNDLVTSVAVSSSGLILSGSNDGTAKLWNMATGALIRTLTGAGHILSVAFSPDGLRALTGGDDKMARVWDVASGRQLTQINVGAAVLSVAFSPDGKTILTGGQNKLAQTWDAQTGARIQQFSGHNGAVESVAFSPDGTNVLTGSDDQTARLWNIQTGQVTQTFSGHGDSVLSVAFSPDGKLIATGSADQTARLWDVNGGAQKLQLGGQTTHTDVVTSIAFSPDGTQLLTASADHTARLWDTQSGSLLRTFAGHTDSINGAAFSADGQYIVTASADKTLRVWTVSAIPGELIGHTAIVNAVAFSPDGKTILTGSADHTVRLWDSVTDQTIQTIQVDQPVEAVAFSSDGQTVLTGDAKGGVKLWNARNGQPIRTFAGPTDSVEAVAFSPDGSLILGGSNDHTVRLWDTATGTLRQTFTHADWVTSIAFSTDGQTILTGSYDGTAKLWDARTGALLKTLGGGDGQVLSAVFSPDDQSILTGGYSDNSARMWDIASGSVTHMYSPGGQKIEKVSFLPPGKTIAALSSDGTLYLLDTASGAELAHVIGQGVNGQINSFAVSPDGSWLVLAWADGSAQVRPVDYLAYANAACSRIFRSPIAFTAVERKLYPTRGIQPICT